MKILCVIGARGGSQRLKHKNIQKYGKTTLLEWAIQNALKSEYIDKIVVDSEDNEILDLAKHYDVDTHQREPSLSNDEVSLYEPVKQVFEDYPGYSLAVIMQVDCPVADHNIIDKCIETYLNHGDSEDVSTFYVGRRTGTVRVIAVKHFFTGYPTANIYSIEDRPDFVDIHTLEDLNRANQYLRDKPHDTFQVANKIKEPVDYNTLMIFNHYERYLKAIELLNINNSDVVIDASCGQGYGSFLLAKHAGTVFGLDINISHLEKAKKYYLKDNLYFGTYNDFQCTVDKIVCNETLEHMPKEELEPFIKKLVGYLAEDGCMFITTPIGKDEPSSYNKWHLNEMSIDTLYKIFVPFFKQICFYMQSFKNSYNLEQEYCTLVLKGYHEKGIDES